MYALVTYPEAEDVPKSYVKFRLVERVQRVRISIFSTDRICMENNCNLFFKLDLWLSQNFIVPQTTPVKTDSQNFWKIAIKSLRDSSLTCVTFEKEIMCINSVNINITADIVQSLASYLNLDHIDVCWK